jgi:hypothetical protein
VGGIFFSKCNTNELIKKNLANIETDDYSMEKKGQISVAGWVFIALGLPVSHYETESVIFVKMP